MPFTFPSHPGLILPLWVWRPALFDGVAMTIAATLPDFLDAAVEIPAGDTSLNLSHSLLGLVVAVIPLAFLLTWLLDVAARQAARRLQARVAAAGGEISPRLAGRATWIRRLGTRRFLPRRVLLSVAIGGFSHLFFDAISHDRFDWLLPWTRPEIVPEPLAGTWVRVWLRGMRGEDLKLGFFGALWVLLSALGALLFVWEAWVASRRRTWR